jgi:hypothetical protein
VADLIEENGLTAEPAIMPASKYEGVAHMPFKGSHVLLIAVAAALAASAAVYFWPHGESAPQTQAPPPLPPESAPAAHYPVDPAAEIKSSDSAQDPSAADGASPSTVTTANPTAAANDETVDGLLANVIGKERLESLFFADDLVRRFVMTINNGADPKLPSQSSLLKPLEGELRVEQSTEAVTLSPENYSRYSAYVDLLTSVDNRQLVGIYARHYPLFQKAYRDLGMTDYFNDRLVDFIDKTISGTEPAEKIRLTRDGYYKFVDPQLEMWPFAKKALIRIGPANAAIVKEKLKGLRDLLTHLGKR